MDIKKFLGNVGMGAAKVGVVAAGAIPGAGPVIEPLAGALVAKIGGHITEVSAKAAFTQAAAEAQPELDQAELDYQAKIAQIASANIISDSSSNDWFVRRARPAFLWVMILAVFFSVVVFPFLNLIDGKGLHVLEIPTGYLDLFAAAFLGYSGMRTVEKVKDKD